MERCLILAKSLALTRFYRNESGRLTDGKGGNRMEYPPPSMQSEVPATQSDCLSPTPLYLPGITDMHALAPSILNPDAGDPMTWKIRSNPIAINGSPFVFCHSMLMPSGEFP